MTRPRPWIAAALILMVGTASAQVRRTAPARSRSATDPQKQAPSTPADARLQYHAAQAALYSALAHAAALEQLSAEPGEPDMDLARTYVHTINRDIQGCDGDSVKVGLAKHEVEKTDSMKTLRSELAEAMKAIDEAQNAVDGHGALGPHAKNTAAHLQKAMIALVQLADAVGVKPLAPPGADAMQDVRSR